MRCSVSPPGQKPFLKSTPTIPPHFGPEVGFPTGLPERAVGVPERGGPQGVPFRPFLASHEIQEMRPCSMFQISALHITPFNQLGESTCFYYAPYSLLE